MSSAPAGQLRERSTSTSSPRGRAPAGRARRAFSRAAFAATVATFILGAFASFGGLGYAAAGASETARAVTKMVTQERVVYSAANDQYGKPEKTVKTDVRKETPSGVASGLGTTGQSGGSLPFTGVSLAATTVLGLGFLGLGIALRRWERSRA